MTKRTTSAIAALLLAPAVAACAPETGTQPSDTGSTHAMSSGYSLPDCTPAYNSGDGSGIELTGRRVTGSFLLTCDPVPGPNEPVIVSYGLEYIPAGGQAAKWLPISSSTSYQDTYTTDTTACHPGAWRVSLVTDTDPNGQFGPWEQITDCTQTLS